MCPYTYTKGTGVHGVTSTDNSAVKTVVRGRKNAYDKYRGHKPIWYISIDVVGKVQKGVSNVYALQQGS